MTWSLVVPGALVPRAVSKEVASAMRAEALRRRLRYALAGSYERPVGALEATAAGAWLAQRFGVPPTTPTAPFLWGALSQGRPQPGVSLWCCDPVHFALTRDDLGVEPIAPASLPEDAAAALAEAADAAVADAGARIVRLGGRWFAGFDRPFELRAQPLALVVGRTARDRLPDGPDAPAWRRMLTRIQMEWHEHPVNVRRAAADLPPVNGLWIHGGGPANAVPSGACALAIGDDAALAGWAHAAGAAIASGPDGAPAVAPGAVVIERWDGLAPAANAQHWGAWLERLPALEARIEGLCGRLFAAGGGETIELVLCGQTSVRTVRLAAADRWKRWRGNDAADLFSAPEDDE